MQNFYELKNIQQCIRYHKQEGENNSKSNTVKGREENRLHA